LPHWKWWKHVETCGQKKLLSSGCIWQSDVPPWRFMALSLTRSFSHVLLSVFQPRCFCASALRWDFSFTRCGMTRLSRSKDPWPQAGEDNELLLWKLRAHERSWEKRKRKMTEIGFRASPRACVRSSIRISIHRESMTLLRLFYDSMDSLDWLHLTSIGSIGSLRIDVSWGEHFSVALRVWIRSTRD
jgi:hypothetical protein